MSNQTDTTTQAPVQPIKQKRTKKVDPVCQICDEKLNKSTHMPIKCQYCNFEACRTCCETYATNEPTVKCMNGSCGREWTRKFIRDVFTLVFINGPLKTHREQLLFDRERALLPATQPIIEGKIACAKLDKDIDEIRRQITALNRRITDLHTQKAAISANPRRGVERSAFVRACPDEDCRGFLSSQWKCGICEKWACPECHLLKGYTRDAEHTCNPDDVATAQLLANDTKPCPKCATGIFKIDGCFSENTPILLYDGSTKMSQDICVGDILVGDDGIKRTVLDTTTGIDDLYEVVQNKATKYTVNSKHTLVLKYCGDRSIIWHETTQRWKVMWFDRTTKKQKTKDFKVSDFETKELAYIQSETFKNSLVFDDVIEICIEDYMLLDATVKRNLMGYKTNGIYYDYVNVDLDPYMLGIWLGDGIHTRPEVATNDIEILNYINQWCKINNAEVVNEKNNKYKYRIKQKTTADSKQCENPLSRLLRKYNLLGNKHIPSDYLLNSRNVRLKLLAGIIDTDGSVSSCGKRVTIIQTRQVLSEQIIFLARSLGYIVNYSIREKKQCVIFDCEPKDYKDQYVINISGDMLSDIPTLIFRKKCSNSQTNKDYLRTSIHVEFSKREKYYGWTVDGNHRFVLPDFTVVRNCDQMWCTQCHTAFSWRTGAIQNNIHNPHYYEWLRRTNGGEAPRNPGDVPCGREMNHRLSEIIARCLRTRHASHPGSTACRQRCDEIVRRTIHLNYAERPTPANYERKNEELRVMYLMKQITEENMKDQLQRDDKRHNKIQEIADIYTIVSATVTDIMYRFLHHIENECRPNEFSTTILDEIEPLVKYANECLADVSHTYSCAKIVFTPNIRIHTGVHAVRYMREQYQIDNPQV